MDSQTICTLISLSVIREAFIRQFGARNDGTERTVSHITLFPPANMNYNLIYSVSLEARFVSHAPAEHSERSKSSRVSPRRCARFLQSECTNPSIQFGIYRFNEFIFRIEENKPRNRCIRTGALELSIAANAFRLDRKPLNMFRSADQSLLAFKWWIGDYHGNS